MGSKTTHRRAQGQALDSLPIHKYNLYVELYKTDHCKKSVINMGIKIFSSSLPLELKSVEYFKVFKKKLKNYLLHSAFYSLQELFCNK
jgi:hypothetical protein